VKTTVNQIVAVVAKYLKAHPARWHEAANHLVVETLIDGFGLAPRDLLKIPKKGG